MQQQGGANYNYSYDGHGNVVSLTNASGVQVATYKYDPWGKLVSKTGTLYNPITYSGYYYDEETGLYYLINRYYDPVDGRFLSRDAYSDVERAPETIDPYVYVSNDPVNAVDPDGNNLMALGAYLIPGVGEIALAGSMAVAALYLTYEVGKGIIFYKEHTKGARKSTEGKHQRGQKRKKVDAGGEKGDLRRPNYRGNKRR